MVALGVQIVLQQLLSEPDMKAWGWRIPFIIGAMGAVAVLWLRRTMDESEQFANIKSQTRKRRNRSRSYETSESSINSSRPNTWQSSLGLPYALTVAIFGGTAEFIALWLKSIGMESLFYFYVAGCIAISFITYWRMAESSKTSQIEAELGGGDSLKNGTSSK